MALRTPSFHQTNDYALLKQCLGNLTPTVAQIEQFCRLSPEWTWENFPIDPRVFPVHPVIKGFSLSKAVIHEIRRLVALSDRYSTEHAFFIAGYKSNDESRGFFKKAPNLHYCEIHSNPGTAISTALSYENNLLVHSHNSKLGELVMLGHTHPNYGDSRNCFSLCDIVYGITQSMHLRQLSPQPMYKIVFAIAYTGNNGNTCLVPLMYDPSKQKNGGSAIFRLE